MRTRPCRSSAGSRSGVVAVAALERRHKGNENPQSLRQSLSLSLLLPSCRCCFLLLASSKQQEEASRGGCPIHNSSPTRHIQSANDQSCPASLGSTPWPARDTHRRRPPARLRQHRLLSSSLASFRGSSGFRQGERWSCAVATQQKQRTHTPSHVNKIRIIQAKKRDCCALVDGNKGSFWRAWEFVVDAFDGAKSWAENGPRLSMDRGGFWSCIE